MPREHGERTLIQLAVEIPARAAKEAPGQAYGIRELFLVRQPGNGFARGLPVHTAACQFTLKTDTAMPVRPALCPVAGKSLIIEQAFCIEALDYALNTYSRISGAREMRTDLALAAAAQAEQAHSAVLARLVAAVEHHDEGVGMGFGVGKTMSNAMESTYDNMDNSNKSKCPNCGEVVSANARFCSTCGKEIIRKKFCSNCGQEVPLGARFCSSCGNKIE